MQPLASVCIRVLVSRRAGTQVREVAVSSGFGWACLVRVVAEDRSLHATASALQHHWHNNAAYAAEDTYTTHNTELTGRTGLSGFVKTWKKREKNLEELGPDQSHTWP